MGFEKELDKELRKLLNGCMDRTRELLRKIEQANFHCAGELRVQRAAIKIANDSFPEVTEKLYWLLEEAEEQLTDTIVKSKYWIEMLAKLKTELRKTKMR